MPFSSIRKPMTWVSAFFRLMMTNRLDEDEPHGQRQAGARRELAQRHERPRDHVGEHHEQAADQERGRGVDVGLRARARRRSAGPCASSSSGDRHALEQEEHAGHDVELPVAGEVRRHGGRRGQRDGLAAERADVRGRAAAPEQHEAEEQDRLEPSIGELGEQGVHRTAHPQERRGDGQERQDEGHAQQLRHAEQPELGDARLEARRSRPPARRASRARRPTATARAAGVSVDGHAPGTNRLASSEKNTSSFSAAAHSISAR